MGYYVGTGDVNIFLDKKHFDDVYKKMCELNDHDELKSGGSFGANNEPVEGDRYNRSKWFSWLPYNYPEICPDMCSILETLGFDFTIDAYGNLVNLNYWDKTGAEDYFMSCFAGFVTDGSYISWTGEESENVYRFLFKDGKMIYQTGEVAITYVDSETYNFGEMNLTDKGYAEYRAKIDKKNK